MSEAFGSTAADGGRSRERTPAWPLLGMGGARGFARRRGVLQMNRNGTGRTRRRGGMLGQGQGNLQEATSPDEIIRKMRSQRIAPPRGAGDTVAALANQRVIEQGHHRAGSQARSEEHTSELQSHLNLVCRLLLEKKKNKRHTKTNLNSECDNV